jgi:uncharacterized protein (TIGR02996 family)
MTEEEAFIQAIADNPADDTPRLIFADWLEERGDPRAEFIRVQCALHQLPSDDSQRAELAHRQRELRRRHEAVWTAPLRGWVDEWEFERGLIERVTLTPFNFTLWADVLFRLAPVRDIHFYRRNHVTLKEIEALADSPYLGRLSVLKLNTDRGIRDDAVRVLAATPSLTNLSSLDLSENWIEDPGAALLAESPHLERLDSLKLGRNRITRQGKQLLRYRFGERVSFWGE